MVSQETEGVGTCYPCLGKNGGRGAGPGKKELNIKKIKHSELYCRRRGKGVQGALEGLRNRIGGRCS